MPKVINKILRQLTPARVKKEIGAVNAIKLPSEIQKWADEYKKIGDPDRNEYLWKWIYRGTKILTENRVEKKYLSRILETKILLFILDTFIDDIVDKPKFKNKKLLKEILKIPFEQKYIKFNHLNKKEKECIKFTIKIWSRIEKIIKRFPEYKKFKEVFEYDFSQVLNMFKYSHLVSKNYYLLNKTESRLYFPHVMQGITHLTLDLMCSSKFNIKELGKLREVGWYAQTMGRIGNAISTWEREIKENDFTSDVFTYGLDCNAISVDELTLDNKLNIIKKIKKNKIEKKLLQEWEQCYLKIYRFTKEIKSINVKILLQALKKIIFFHLSSRGYK